MNYKWYSISTPVFKPMPIKNYTTKVPANKSIAEIQDALVNHGATGVLYEYEQGQEKGCVMPVKHV